MGSKTLELLERARRNEVSAAVRPPASSKPGDLWCPACGVAPGAGAVLDQDDGTVIHTVCALPLDIVEAKGRSCGCAAKGKHRKTCSKAVKVAKVPRKAKKAIKRAKKPATVKVLPPSPTAGESELEVLRGVLDVAKALSPAGRAWLRTALEA